MHTEAYQALQLMRDRLPFTPTGVYEIGSREVIGSRIRDLFPDVPYHGVDLEAGPGVDAVGDACTHVPPFAPDVIVCAEVLEHTAAREALLRQCYEVLRPGGALFITTAGLLRRPHTVNGDGDPEEGEFYANLTQSELSKLLTDVGFSDLTVWSWDRDQHSLFNPVTTPPERWAEMVRHIDLYAIAHRPQADSQFTRLYIKPFREEEMRARIRKTQTDYGDICQQFHRVFYESDHTWTWTTFLGQSVLKPPTDLWVYQEILANHRPVTVLETGTAYGGSALWFAFLMDMLGIEGGRVLTCDLDRRMQFTHPRITFFQGDSTDPGLAAEMLAEATHPLLVTLDADHAEAHVAKELALYAPAVQPGEWLIVEDTNIAWEGFNRGARGAVQDFLDAHPDEWLQEVLCERYLITHAPGGWLRRVKECACAQSRRKNQ